MYVSQLDETHLLYSQAANVSLMSLNVISNRRSAAAQAIFFLGALNLFLKVKIVPTPRRNIIQFTIEPQNYQYIFQSEEKIGACWKDKFWKQKYSSQPRQKYWQTPDTALLHIGRVVRYNLFQEKVFLIIFSKSSWWMIQVSCNSEMNQWDSKFGKSLYQCLSELGCHSGIYVYRHLVVHLLYFVFQGKFCWYILFILGSLGCRNLSVGSTLAPSGVVWPLGTLLPSSPHPPHPSHPPLLILLILLLQAGGENIPRIKNLPFLVFTTGSSFPSEIGKFVFRELCKHFR